MSFLSLDSARPQFVKDDASASVQVDALRMQLASCSDEERPRIERSLRLQEAGLRGEEQIVFELKNSHLPLYALRDLHLEHEGLKAQVDFLVIMPYVNVIIECKNLVGDITINDRGDFIRTFGEGSARRTEGIYSPVTQNERHRELMRCIRLEGQGMFGKLANRLWFDDVWKSLVVLANPRTVLDDSQASGSVREQIVRGDGLIVALKELDLRGKKTGNAKRSLRDMQAVADYWLRQHIADASREVSAGMDEGRVETAVPCCPKCGSPMVRRRVMRGARKGREIWGCSRFPKCRQVVNID